MKKTDYDAKLKRADEHLAAKQYPKALAEFTDLYNSDKPLGKTLGLPDQIEKLQGLVKEQGFLAIRGLGVIILEALDKKNQFQEIYRLPITREEDSKGNDTHPLRLPAILRTSFVKATSADWLQEQVDIFKENEAAEDEELAGKIKKLEETIKVKSTEIKDLEASNEDLQSQIDTLSKPAKGAKPAKKGTEEKL